MYPWQQHPDESSAWYVKFQTYYLSQGPGASLLEAENRYRDEKGRKRTEGNSGAWRRESARTGWEMRADEYWRAQGEDAVEETADSITAQQGAINDGRTKIAGHASDAIEALHDIATDVGAPASSRVSAANSILDRVGITKHVPEPEDAPEPPPAWDLTKLTSEQLRTFIALARLAESAGDA